MSARVGDHLRGISMADVYFKNIRTGLKYRVVGMDKVKGEVTLASEHGQWVEAYDKERFQRLGYILVMEEADAEN